jgi:hypothetical protein
MRGVIMKRVIKEGIDFSGEEKGKFDYVRGMLANLINEIEKEVTCSLDSNLLLDTKFLLNTMDKYSRKYYEDEVSYGD